METITIQGGSQVVTHEIQPSNYSLIIAHHTVAIWSFPSGSPALVQLKTDLTMEAMGEIIICHMLII